MFDEKGQLPLDFKLGGTVQKPSVTLQGDAIQQRFLRQATAALEKEVKQEAQKYVDELLKGQKDQVTKELKQKVDQGRQQLKEEVKQQEGQQRKRLEDEAKKKLRGLFGK